VSARWQRREGTERTDTEEFSRNRYVQVATAALVVLLASWSTTLAP